ncbi:MAG: D-amino acid dehydrogenase [Pseudomonadota bacterium]
MRIAVLGAGVVGVASAYYLTRAGHQVTVLDRRPGPAQETSFANAGEISPGYSAPWAAPGIPMKALKWLMMEHPPLILEPPLDWATFSWLLATLRNCTAGRYAINKSRMVRLADYSRDQLIALRVATGISYDERQQGTLQLFRTQQQLDDVGKDVAVLKAEGVPFEVLDRAGCAAAEPGLAGATADIAGGLRLPLDETGDCYKFTVALTELARAVGAEFHFDTPMHRLLLDGGRIKGVQTDAGVVEADAFVLALGSHSPRMVRPLGLRLPVYPVKGYSITVPIVEADRAPVSTVLDESYKVAITRLGDRIRVGGMAEVSGYNDRLPPERRGALEHSLKTLFPGAADLTETSFWCGLRPMTPDGTPVVGATPIKNLYLNTGHGTLGWTMACGSGRLIADLVSGVTPEIESGDLSIARY